MEYISKDEWRVTGKGFIKKSKRHYFGWLIVYTSQKSELSVMALIVLTA